MKRSMYKNKDELPMFLTVMDVANLLGISRASAYELVREENFPKLKIVQGRTIIPRDRLLEWLDEQTRYSAYLCLAYGRFMEKQSWSERPFARPFYCISVISIIHLFSMVFFGLRGMEKLSKILITIFYYIPK